MEGVEEEGGRDRGQRVWEGKEQLALSFPPRHHWDLE